MISIHVNIPSAAPRIRCYKTSYRCSKGLQQFADCWQPKLLLSHLNPEPPRGTLGSVSLVSHGSDWPIIPKCEG